MARRMTLREKKERAEAREELRKMGLLPEKKKPLNRRKFVEEVRKELTESIGVFNSLNITIAMTFMYPEKYKDKITSEDIGIVKLIKAAIEINKLDNKANIKEIMENIINPLKEL